MTDKRRKPDAERRRAINRLVHPTTIKLLEELSASLGISEGKVLDRAVQALAVAESFGARHLKLDRLKPCADGGGGHSFDRDGFCNYCGNTLEQVAFGGEHLRLRAPIETAKLYAVKHSTQPTACEYCDKDSLPWRKNGVWLHDGGVRCSRYDSTSDATGIDHDSKRGKASLQVVQPRRETYRG